MSRSQDLSPGEIDHGGGSRHGHPRTANLVLGAFAAQPRPSCRL